MLHDEEQTSVSQERTFLLCNLIHLSYVTAQSLWSLHLPHVTGKRFPVWVNSAIQRTSCVWPDTSRHGVKVFNYCVRLLFQIQNKSLKWSFRWNMYSVFYLFIESFTCLKARHYRQDICFFMHWSIERFWAFCLHTVIFILLHCLFASVDLNYNTYIESVFFFSHLLSPKSPLQ